MRGVLSHIAFRNLWLAQTTSVIGDRMVIVALALFVNDLTGSATDIGFVLGAQTLPFVAFLLIGGVWADRLPRARLMIATDVARAVLFDVFWHTTMAEQIPPEALSRVSAYDWMGSLMLLPVGYLVAGPIAVATSADGVLVVSGAATAVLLLVGLLPRDTRTLHAVAR